MNIIKKNLFLFLLILLSTSTAKTDGFLVNALFAAVHLIEPAQWIGTNLVQPIRDNAVVIGSLSAFFGASTEFLKYIQNRKVRELDIEMFKIELDKEKRKNNEKQRAEEKKQLKADQETVLHYQKLIENASPELKPGIIAEYLEWQKNKQINRTLEEARKGVGKIPSNKLFGYECNRERRSAERYYVQFVSCINARRQYREPDPQLQCNRFNLDALFENSLKSTVSS